MNCWGGANRARARCESSLGQIGPARAKLVAVIERVPVLPMQDIAKPREVIEALGQNEAEGLIAEGASQSIDESLAAVRHWLLDA